MALSGPQLRQFADALLAGFPTRASLEQLSLDGFGLTLDAVAGEGALPKQIRDLIIQAQANGTLDALLAAAVEAQPKNGSLQQLATDYPRWKFDALVPQPPTAPRDVNPTQLRHAIVDAFSVEELATLSADVESLLTERGTPIRVSLEIVGGSGKPAQVLNLIQYLQRRGQLAVLLEAVRAARPGLV